MALPATPLPRKPRPSDEAILELFEQGLGNGEIAGRLHSTPSTISSRLHALGKTRRRTGTKLARFVRRVVDYQKAHPSISFAEVARHFRISPCYAGLIFAREGCKTPFPPRTKKPPQIGMYSGGRAEQLVQAFQELGSSKRVAARFHLTRSYVNQVLQVMGCRTKRQARPYDLQKAKARYESGESLRDIARDLKIGEHRLRREIDGAGGRIRHKTAWLKGWHEERREAVAKMKKFKPDARKLDPLTEARIALAACRKAQDPKTWSDYMLTDELKPGPRDTFDARRASLRSFWRTHKQRIKLEMQRVAALPQVERDAIAPAARREISRLLLA
jgi:hypothetical protein